MSDTSLGLGPAQSDMRAGYYSGAPGMASSGLVWLVAGLVALMLSPVQAVIALFVGGMFIHPLGVLGSKLLGRSGSHTAGNPLGALAMETTVLMLLCFPITFALAQYRIEWFFPAMMLVIGGRYLCFATVYGLRVYWICGGVLACAAMLLVFLTASPAYGAFSGAVIELGFASLIYARSRQTAAE